MAWRCAAVMEVCRRHHPPRYLEFKMGTALPSISFTKIPIIDLAKAYQPQGHESMLKELRHALTEVGFLYIRNHGVPEEVTENLKNALPRLFAITEKEKKRVALERSPHFLGYSGIGAETTAGEMDRREQFEFATELESTWSEGRPMYKMLKGPNQFPAAYPALRPIVECYINRLTQLGVTFLTLVAEALLLPKETFIPFLSDQHRLKLVHYAEALDGQSSQGVGPHKDSSGWWTFLLQASPPDVKGLQALNKSGDWIDVPNIPGTFVVNIGQAFEVVTNGVCKATTHRVLSQTSERFSVPFFQGVRLDLTKSEALDTLAEHFRGWHHSGESDVGSKIDSAFLSGAYDTWGESQLRTKIRSHRDVGKRFYGSLYEQYVEDA